MIATFREFSQSLKDLNYGSEIIQKPVKSVFWYWLKFLLLYTLVPLLMTTFTFTRILPESPKLIKKYLPDGFIQFKDGLLSSTIKQPISNEFTDENGYKFNFIFDLSASPSALEKSDLGVLILSDQIVVKTDKGVTQTQKYTSVPNLFLDKNIIADWVTENRYKLYVFGLSIIITLSVLILLFTVFARFISFLTWALLFLIIDILFFKKKIKFWQYFNLVVYASVLPLLLSVFLLIFPNPILSLLNTGLFVMYVYLWTKNLKTN